jgi:hypothetical protein
MIVTIQLWQLMAISNMSCEHPDACQMCVQLGAKDHDALWWDSL